MAKKMKRESLLAISEHSYLFKKFGVVGWVKDLTVLIEHAFKLPLMILDIIFGGLMRTIDQKETLFDWGWAIAGLPVDVMALFGFGVILGVLLIPAAVWDVLKVIAKFTHGRKR